MILPMVCASPRVQALLDEIRLGKPGAAMAEKWLWLEHKRLLKARDKLRPPLFAPLAHVLMASGHMDMVMLEANQLAVTIHAMKQEAETAKGEERIAGKLQYRADENPGAVLRSQLRRLGIEEAGMPKYLFGEGDVHVDQGGGGSGDGRAGREGEDVTRETILAEIHSEACRADGLYGPLLNPHHALGVMLEEYEEFKDGVKIKDGTPGRIEYIRTEAKHMAAVGARIMEMCDRILGGSNGKS